MKYGCILTGSPQEVVELAGEAEKAGWDGVFLPDDWTTAWMKLTAIAMCTHRIRLGTMLTPLPEQSPWYVAAQTAVLDQLSGGRVILAAGLGVLVLDKFGLSENRVRAQRLDEALEIIAGWWQGTSLRAFTYEGQHYRLQEMEADLDWRTHAPLQTPRIPIWVVGGSQPTQIRRSARWDGAIVSTALPATLAPAELRARKEAIAALRTSPEPFDIITEGETPYNDPQRASALVRPFEEAGATWWLESMWEMEGVTRDCDLRTRIRSGPPRTL